MDIIIDSGATSVSNREFFAIIELVISSEELPNKQHMTIDYIKSNNCYKDNQHEKASW